MNNASNDVFHFHGKIVRSEDRTKNKRGRKEAKGKDKAENVLKNIIRNGSLWPSIFKLQLIQIELKELESF